MSDALSLRAFGRQVGVSGSAVCKAIRTGRLRRGVGERDGRPAIVDVDAARAEWAAGATRPRSSAQPRPGRADGSLIEIQRQIAVQRERRLRLENDARESRVLPVDQVERAQRGIVAAAKNQLLSVPRRAVLAGLPREHEPLVRQLIVDALRELAAIGTAAALEAVEDEL